MDDLERNLMAWCEAGGTTDVPATLHKFFRAAHDLEDAVADGEPARAVELAAECATRLMRLVRGLASGATLSGALRDKLAALERRAGPAPQPCPVRRTLEQQDEPASPGPLCAGPIASPRPLCAGPIVELPFAQSVPEGAASEFGTLSRERQFADGCPLGETKALAAAAEAMAATIALDAHLVSALAELPQRADTQALRCLLTGALEKLHLAHDAAQNALGCDAATGQASEPSAAVAGLPVLPQSTVYVRLRHDDHPDKCGEMFLRALRKLGLHAEEMPNPDGLPHVEYAIAVG